VADSSPSAMCFHCVVVCFHLAVQPTPKWLIAFSTTFLHHHHRLLLPLLLLWMHSCKRMKPSSR
jgi:hypothetical protein